MRAVVKAKKPIPEKLAATDLVIRNLDKAMAALDHAKTAQETKKVVDTISALQTYARRQKLSEEVKARGYAIWIEAMAQLDRYLASEPKAIGTRGQLKGDVPKGTKLPVGGIESLPPTPTLAERGISKQESALAQKIGALPEETREAVKSGLTKLNAAFRSIEENRLKENLLRPVEVKLPSGARHGDFRELSKTIPDNSVQLIFTDPPYDGDSVALYGAAALVAARILKPGGSFIVYSGQKHLPEVLAACSKHLRYWWTMACVYEGGNQVLQNLGVRCGWKPMVWFVKGTRGVQNVVLDTVSGGREKDSHVWQQAESEAAYFIEKFTSRDGLVVDFFLGSGTTAAACAKLGRKWIGFEIDAAALEKTAKRFSQ